MERKISVTGYKCDHCGHEWIPRFPSPPEVCPKCKRRNWNKSREVKREK